MIPEPFTEEEKHIIAVLDTPRKISEYMHTGLSYDKQDDYPEHLLINRSFRKVLRDKKAHCLDGAIFAAALMREHGYVPYVICLDAYKDHSHNIMVYRDKTNNHIGSLAISRDQNLWERKPVYDSIYELMLSYFYVYSEYAENMDDFHESEKGHASVTMMGYSQLIDLNAYLGKGIDWITGEKSLDTIESDLYDITYRFMLLPGKKIRKPYYQYLNGGAIQLFLKNADGKLFELS